MALVRKPHIYDNYDILDPPAACNPAKLEQHMVTMPTSRLFCRHKFQSPFRKFKRCVRAAYHYGSNLGGNHAGKQEIGALFLILWQQFVP